jgi:hypothetical protein
MVGITLSPEQIRRAPVEVRRWLQSEVAASLSGDAEPAPAGALAHLATCSPEEAAAIYNDIRGALPVVNLFFELGRGGEFVTPEGLVAHRLADMLRHTRLLTLEQLFVVLQTINQAARRLSADPDLSLYLIDQRGYCFVPADTQKSIAALWEQLISRSDISGSQEKSNSDQPRGEAAFPSLHGELPSNAAHLSAFSS